MDTKGFLDLVLPSEGGRVVGVRYPGGGVKHIRFETNSEATACIAREDSAGNQIYIAPNSFGPAYADPETGKTRLATRRNVVACRSLYDDFDAGPDGYADKVAAWDGVQRFGRLLGLAPWVVDSGGGYHAYIVMSRDVDRSEWEALSHLKRRITKQEGMPLDRGVDMAAEHTLRPVGSWNRKRDPAVPVKVVARGEVYDPETVREWLEAAVARVAAPDLPRAGGTGAPKRPAHIPASTRSAFPAMEIDSPPSDAEAVAEKCAAIRALRDSNGVVREPHWVAALGVLKHCSNGAEAAHRWSAGHPTYTFQETQAKIDGWEFGPARCETLDLHANCMKTCPFAGKITSPIQLGVAEPSPAESLAAADPDPSDLPDGFWWSEDHQTLFHRLPPKGEDDEGKVVPVANRYFWLANRVWDPVEGKWQAVWSVPCRNGSVRPFRTPTSVLADPRAFSKHLAEQEVFVADHPSSARIAAVMGQKMVSRMLAFDRHAVMHPQFGWALHPTERNRLEYFAIGRERIDADGEGDLHRESDEVIYDRKMFPDLDSVFEVAGTLEKWTEFTSFLLDRPGAEPWQFALCHAMGSVLVRLAWTTNWHGLPLALVGEKGSGKSSACKIALGFFGEPRRLERQATEQGQTPNMLVRRAMLTGDVPVLMDELSGRQPAEIVGILYSLANGREKERMSSSGDAATVGEEFYKNTLITSNNSLQEIVTRIRARDTTEATQLRVFEVPMSPDFQSRVFSGVDRTKVEEHMDNCYGAPLRRYIRHIIRNQDSVTERLRDLRQSHKPDGPDGTAERYYRDTVATAMLAGELGREIGVIGFSLGNMQSWALNHIEEMRETRRDLNRETEDHVNSFLLSLEGRVIVTNYMNPTTYGEQEAALRQLTPHKTPAARACIVDELFYVLVSAVADYCSEHGIQQKQFRKAMEAQGILIRGDETSRKMTIGRGAGVSSSQARIYELDFHRAYGKLTLASESPSGESRAAAGNLDLAPEPGDYDDVPF